MYTSLIVMWILVGWCGNWRPRPWPFPPPPPPPPDWLNRITGVVGGLAGGFAFNYVWPLRDSFTGVDVAATAVGAYIGTIILSDAYGMMKRQ